ncbi:methyltransferase domain-containing protein [Candidatus Micrarchaeota archaeon]|nr:methyltransferase domain-containing protein [Candidatus Micrarchaeota archaeon]
MDKPDFHFPALLKKCKRGGPAVTHPKDAGLVMAYTGIGKDSVVVELGSGSGFMTIQMANIVKHVTTYEKRKEFQELAIQNVKKAGLTNVEFKLRDVFEGIDETDVDLIFCDVAEPEKIINGMHDAIRIGCFISAHCLNIEQAKALHLAAEKVFKEVFTLDCLVKDYDVRDFGTRPKHFGLMHTAYMVFARK